MWSSWLRFVLGTMCVYGLAADIAFSTPLVHVMPPNIIVDRRLDDIVTRMLFASPTFRDQTDYLGRVKLLRVRVMLRGSLEHGGQSQCRAEATIRRFQFGSIDALVRLPSRNNAAELIAHELEHVREYVDGVNHRYLAARLGSGVWGTSRTGQYETQRAIAIGKRVAGEMEVRTIHD